MLKLLKHSLVCLLMRNLWEFTRQKVFLGCNVQIIFACIYQFLSEHASWKWLEHNKGRVPSSCLIVAIIFFLVHCYCGKVQKVFLELLLLSYYYYRLHTTIYCSSKGIALIKSFHYQVNNSEKLSKKIDLVI